MWNSEAKTYPSHSHDEIHLASCHQSDGLDYLRCEMCGWINIGKAIENAKQEGWNLNRREIEQYEKAFADRGIERRVGETTYLPEGMAARLVNAERERCARIAANYPSSAAELIAAEIRKTENK